MISRGRLQSVSHRKRKKRLLKIRSIAIGVVAVLIVVGCISVTHLKAIRIANIYASGNKLLTDDEVKAVVKSEISGSYWFLFPKDNIFYFPRSTIEKRFLKDHLEVSAVAVSFKDFKSITVAFKERQPVALFCSRDEAGAPCYFVDETGYVFKEGGAYGSDSSYVSFIKNFGTSTLGSTILPQQEFSSVRSFVDLMAKQKINITAIAIKDGGVREGLLQGGGTIIWNADEDLGLAYQNLLLLVSSPQFDGKTADGALNVEYIDLQNQNKIFYKVKGAK